jgi:FixJ family two-component response regulator
MQMQQPHILIVDDDDQICRLLLEVFASWGMQATHLKDPRQVSEELQQHFYNLIMLDIVMPGVSGLDLLAEIHEYYPDTKVIIMTGYADKTSAIEALRLGAFDFLEKPFALDLLSHAVKRALHTQKVELEHKNTLKKLQQSQADLLDRQEQLEALNSELMDTNKALSVLVKTVERTRQETEMRIVLKIKSLIIPMIEKLRRDDHMKRYESHLTSLIGYMEDLTSGLASNSHITASLSFTELRIASMIKNGMTNDEIAMQLHIAPDTVKTHRKNIRRKLKIVGSGNNLRSYLQSMESSYAAD